MTANNYLFPDRGANHDAQENPPCELQPPEPEPVEPEAKAENSLETLSLLHSGQ